MTGPELRALRERHGISQEKLAVQINTGQFHLSEVENGHRALTPEFLKRCLRGLWSIHAAREETLRVAFQHVGLHFLETASR